MLTPRPRHLHLRRRDGARAARRVAAASSRASSSSSPAAPGRASRRCCAPRPAWSRTSTAGRSPAAASSAASTRASTARPTCRASPGTLFQDPETQVVLGTVRAELAFPLENAGLSGAAVARGVEEAALALGIAELLDRSTSELSGGELQRVALGAALATRPALVLLDEPTSQLDPVAGDELLGVLRRLNEEWGTTVLLAEHRLERCLAAADRVIAMRDGAVAFDGARRATSSAGRRRRPGARLFALAGIAPPPVSVKDARADSGDSPLSPQCSELSTLRGQSPQSQEFGTVAGGQAGVAGAARRAAAAAGRVAEGRAGRGRGAAGPQRGGEVDAAADRRRARQADAREGEGGRPRRAAAADARATTSCTTRVGGDGPLADRHPRDLSGGERQTLALDLVLGGRPPFGAAVGRTDPRHGPAAQGRAGATRIAALARAGRRRRPRHPRRRARRRRRARGRSCSARARSSPTRRPREVLGGGWYFATQTARILGGAALTPEEGAELLQRARCSHERDLRLRSRSSASR